MFKGARYHFDFTASVMHGVEMGALQVMHEMTHLSQVVNHRYQLEAKKVKIEGQKQLAFRARWLGKKQGLIDDMPWQARPWEQEASLTGNQLAAEFMAMIQAQQTAFPAQGLKKELKLYPVAFALPEMPAVPMAPPTSMPEMGMPEVGMPQVGMPDMGLPQVGGAEADSALGQPQASEADLMADIDAILASGDMQDQAQQTAPQEPIGTDIFGAPLGATSFDAPSLEAPGMDTSTSAAIYEHDDSAKDKKTFIQGVAEPRILKATVLASKRQELAQRGLLEK